MKRQGSSNYLWFAVIILSWGGFLAAMGAVWIFGKKHPNAIQSAIGWRMVSNLQPTSKDIIPSVPKSATLSLETHMEPIPDSVSSPPPKLPQRDSTRSSELRYQFQVGKFYAWNYELGIPNRVDRTISGSCMFQTTAKAEPPSKITEGSGTGFVVSADGLLVTCAHVVEGASSIQVDLGGKSFAAKLLAIDGGLDLAMLKLPTSGLSPLFFAPAESIELAQEVRSFGFPLSDVLGESLKITRGTLSGKLEREGRKLLQVDASINPGNSGGPVIDLYGRVIGVASEKMHGQEISNVGFCVPSEEVVRWLRAQRVEAFMGKQGLKREGPELAKAIAPSVAMIKVKSNGGLPEGAEGFQISDSSFDSLIPIAGWRSPSAGKNSGKAYLDTTGQLECDENCHQLPFLMGPTLSLAMIPLPKAGQSSWGSERTVQLQIVEEEKPEDLYDRLRRQSLFRPGGGGVQKITVLEAFEKEQFRIVERPDVEARSQEEVAIERVWQLRSQGEPARISVRGVFRYLFSQEIGMIKSMEGDLHFGDAEPERVSLKIKLNLSESKRNPTSPSPNSSQVASEVTMPAHLASILDRLKMTETAIEERVTLLQSVAKEPLHSKYRAQVVLALQKELENGSPLVRVAALQGLIHWDNATSSTAVVELLRNPSIDVRTEAVRYFGAMQDGDMAKHLVEALSDTQLRKVIYDALRSIGPTAEASVIGMLSHQEGEVRVAGCQILAQIGSTKCFEGLRRLAQGTGSESVEAKKTLQILGVPGTQPQRPSADERNPFEPQSKSTSEDDENPFEPKRPEKASDNENPFATAPK